MKIGFIGCGNMASAMIRGILGAGLCSAEELSAAAPSAATQAKIREELGIRCLSDRECAGSSDVLFLAVKPQYYEEVIREVRDDAAPDTLIISIAPGKTLAWLSEQFGGKRKIIRSMPNTPAMVGEGMAGLCPGGYVTE
jgi:pyrroline-5-carboxylate reductase